MTPRRSTSRASSAAASSGLPPRYVKGKSGALSGGFGVVEKVHDTFLDRTVVFKSMQDSDDNDQLLQEIRAIAAARSRHVVEIYDVILDDAGNVTGIIIEYLPGRDFDGFHKEAQADPAAYLRVLYQVATAVSDIHAAGVTHRDLKLANMRASVSGILKVFDFGLSSVDSKYATTNNRGTRVYAAPELYVKGATITPQMDIYALGICAWALASAKFPAELLEAPPQRSNRAPSIRSVLPSLPEDLSEEIDRCLHPEPSERPKADALSRLLSRHLVRDQHKGLLVLDNGGIYEISHATRNAVLRIRSMGELKVQYDGVSFYIAAASGEVFKNNNTVVVGTSIEGACLFTFGGAHLGNKRSWIPFFPSHPEIIL